MEWITRGKPSALGVASGIVAGLVAVTPAAGFVTPMSGAIIGLAAGVVCFLAVTKVKIALGYDDSLDAFGVHCVGGILGALLTGIFADASINPAIASTFKDAAGNAVSLEGSMTQLIRQATAVGITLVIAVVGSFIILKIVDAVVGLRVTEEEESNGLDISLHGEEGYVDMDGGSTQGHAVGHATATVGVTKTATASH
jgi:Amt family ammonium transporter